MRKFLTTLIALAAIIAITASSFAGSMTLLGVGKAPGGGGGAPTFTATANMTHQVLGFASPATFTWPAFTTARC